MDHANSILSLLRPTTITDIVAIAFLAAGSASYVSKGHLWDRPDPHSKIFYTRPQLGENGIDSRKQESRNIVQKLEEHRKDLVIFWGSQSGTAEGLASRLSRELKLGFGLEALVADLSDYDSETIALLPNTKLAIFIISTYGEGDPSDNTFGFWDWIHKDVATNLRELRYAAFGLGNSNYKYYNRVIDETVTRLDNFGAEAIVSTGRADDANGKTQENFEDWQEQLFACIEQRLGVARLEAKYQPLFSVIEDDSLEHIDLHHGMPRESEAHGKAANASSAVKPITIRATRELFTSPNRNCLHVDFDISEHADLHYKTGDHLAVWPINPEQEVNLLLQILGISDKRQKPLLIKSLDETVPVKIPSPTTADAIIRHYLEICAPLSRESLSHLAQFAPSAKAKSYIQEISQDRDTYSTYLQRNHVTLGRVLNSASSGKTWAELSLAYLIETFPHLKPRYYSISSSSVISPRQPSITVTVSKTPLPEAPTTFVPGLASNYLLALSNTLGCESDTTKADEYRFAGPSDMLSGSQILAHIRKSHFKLPISSSCPLVMVAAGTGLAPFMAFLSERKRLSELGRPIGEMILFFGCRDPAEDFIYQEELSAFQESLGLKLRIVTAFSRVQGQEKTYVQDCVKENEELVLRLMDEGASFYVCGRARMSKDVEREVLGSIERIKGWDEAKAAEWMGQLKSRRKWQEDVWG